MSFKNITTVLLIIVATALLTTLALKVRPCKTDAVPGKGQVASRGCCGNGCAMNSQNKGAEK